MEEVTFMCLYLTQLPWHALVMEWELFFLNPFLLDRFIHLFVWFCCCCGWGRGRGSPQERLLANCRCQKLYTTKEVCDKLIPDRDGHWPNWRLPSSVQSSPRAHLHVLGMLRFMSVTKANRACPLLLFCSCVCFCLYGPFNYISFHKFSKQLIAFSPCSSGFISALLVLSTIYLFMRVSLSPDIIFCGWRGLKRQLTN